METTELLNKLKGTPVSELDNVNAQPKINDDVFNTASHTKEETFPSESVTFDVANTTTIPENKTSLGTAVSGKFAVDLMDTLLPSLSVLLIGYAGYVVEKKQLMLNAKERETIAPAFQAYLDSISINFDKPIYNLLFVIGAVYAAKIVDVLPSLKKTGKAAVKKEKSKEVPAEIEAQEEAESEATGDLFTTKQKGYPVGKVPEIDLNNYTTEQAVMFLVRRFRLSKEMAAKRFASHGHGYLKKGYDTRFNVKYS